MIGNLQIGKFFDRLGLAFIVLIILRLASGPTADLAHVLLVLYALRSRAQSIEALFLSFVFISLNPSIFPSSTLAEIARYFVVVASAVSIFFRSKIWKGKRFDSVILTVAIFATFLIGHSIFFSSIIVISLLKSLIWGLAFLTLLVGWQDLARTDADRVEFRIYVTLTTLIFISVLLISQSPAYVPRTPFLRGALVHSQALGIVASIIAVWTMAKIVVSKKPSLLQFMGLSIAMIAVTFSYSRTALISSAITMILLFSVAKIRGSTNGPWKTPGLKSPKFILFAVFGIIVLLAGSEFFASVLLKRSGFSSQEVSVVALYNASRGGLAEAMWFNIQKDPLVGVGFGLSSNIQEMNITYFQGIPIGATVEKGITFLAVWEEVGLVGVFLFSFLIAQVLLKSLRLGPERLSIFIVIFLLNLGEATLLSVGGVGLLELILWAWVISGGRRSGVKAFRAPVSGV